MEQKDLAKLKKAELIDIINNTNVTELKEKVDSLTKDLYNSEYEKTNLNLKIDELKGNLNSEKESYNIMVKSYNSLSERFKTQSNYFKGYVAVSAILYIILTII